MVAPTLLTVAQCAERLGISQAVIRAAIQAGTLPAYRIGRPGKRGHFRIEAYQLDLWVQSLKVSVASPGLNPAPAKPARPGGPPRLSHLRLG